MCFVQRLERLRVSPSELSAAKFYKSTFHWQNKFQKWPAAKLRNKTDNRRICQSRQAKTQASFTSRTCSPTIATLAARRLDECNVAVENGALNSTSPKTEYARSGQLNIAYQVVGNGPRDLVYVPGWVSHLELAWEEPTLASFLRRLASFSRLITFDKRGTGLSDRVTNEQLPTLEQRMDDAHEYPNRHSQGVALIMHPTGDQSANVEEGRWIASQIPGARFVELVGDDHFPWVGDQDAVLDEVEEFLTGARRVPEPNRVLATVMFTDIVGSTERAASGGDRAWLNLLDQHHSLVRKHLERFRGQEVKTAGDSFVATFDGPARAIQCACHIRDGMRQLGLEIRAGLHTGEIEIRDKDIAGIAVHIAARTGALAAANEVLVSSTVKDLVAGSGIQFVDRGSRTLKGIPDEWRLFAVG
jgi:class 3 adenylate cyclase